MKLSNKPNAAAGIILLAAAAFFAISLCIQLLDFGLFGPEKQNFLYTMGKMLTSVYGISSILIPAFLLMASVSCFVSRWTARKTMQLLTAIIPFFTSVGMEKLCRLIASSKTISGGNIIIAITLLIGLALMAAEFIFAGILADIITGTYVPRFKFHGFRKNKKGDENNVPSEKNSETDEIFAFEDETENTDSISEDNEDYENSEQPEIDPSMDNVFEEAEQNEVSEEDLAQNDAEPVSESDEESAGEEISDENDEEFEENDDWARLNSERIVVPAAETKNLSDTENNNHKDTTVESPFYTPVELENNDSSSETADSIYENPSDVPENEETPTLSEESLNSESGNASEPLIEEQEKTAEIENPDTDYEEPANPATLISQEEYAALTGFNDPEPEAEPEDELSWPDPAEIKAKAGNPESEKNTLDPDFFDIDLNEDSDLNSDIIKEEIQEENEEDDEDLNDDIFSSDFKVPENNEPKEDFEEPEVSDSPDPTQTLSSDIFQDMENEIREEVKNEGSTYDLNANKPVSDEKTVSGENEPLSDESVENDDIPSEEAEEQTSFETAPAPVHNTIKTEPKTDSHRAMPKKPYIVPTDLLEEYGEDQYWIVDEQTKADALKLKETLQQFDIEAEVIGIKKGPVVTMFEIAPAPGVRLSKIVGLQDNIALSLAASSVRIVAPIPGKAAVGIEVPNRKRSIVSFREMIEQDLPEFKKMAVPVVLGKDILGKSQIIDIAKTPHLLIAGATGAGKSVCVNSIILSILYKRSPRQVKMILVDPKVVELKLYNDIPHLLTPVITEPKKALQALQWCLCEMERRYAMLDQMGVRDIAGYNKRIDERNICTEKLPYIVIIIDEFADLMATSGKELESNVARLAAMSRAVGIHLVLATQRPSVNVITGLIKANIPSRIAFMVSSRTDSNIIIDSVGAEKLLGKGDMLYASAVDPYPVRIQGTFESDNDVENVVNYVKTLGEPEYIDDEIFVETDDEDEGGGSGLFNDGSSDPLYEQALDIVIQSGKASASYLQRRLSIGYNRAARLVEEMEARGIVGPANGSKPREIIHVPD